MRTGSWCCPTDVSSRRGHTTSYSRAAAATRSCSVCRRRDTAMAELMAGGLLAVLLIVALRWRLRVVTVSGESMAPAYHDGDQLLVVRSRRRVRIGAVIVFVPPAGFTEMPWLVKRVVGLKGDRRSERFVVRGDAA